MMLKPSTYFAYITTSNQTAHILGYSYARLLFCRGSLTPGSFIPRLPIPGFLKPVYIQIRQGMSAVSNLQRFETRKGCCGACGSHSLQRTSDAARHVTLLQLCTILRPTASLPRQPKSHFHVSSLSPLAVS
jgi:hypothetical protein